MMNSTQLDFTFKIKEGIEYRIDDNNIVTVLEKQDHKIQRFFRKLKVKIPMYRKITLDQYSSEVFIQLDGVKTVEEIGKYLENKYGEEVYPLYERLMVFLNYIYTDCKYIEKVK